MHGGTGRVHRVTSSRRAGRPPRCARPRAAGRAPGRRPRGSARRTSRSLDRRRARRSSARTKAVASGADRANRSPPRVHLTSASPATRSGEAVDAVVGDDPAAARISTRSASFSASSRSWVVSRMVVCSRCGEVAAPAGGTPDAPAGRSRPSARRGRAARAPDDAHRDVEAATLPSRQGRDLAVGEVGQPDRLEQQVDVVRPLLVRAWSTARSSRRAGSAADAGSTAGGRATTAARRRCGPASPRRRVSWVLAEDADLAGGPDPETLRGSRSSWSCPAPFGPSRQTTSPGWTSKSTPVSTSLSP